MTTLFYLFLLLVVIQLLLQALTTKLPSKNIPHENGTQVGVMIGAGAANTGLFWMRLGGAGEAGELRRADMEGRNVALFCGDWAWEREVRHQLFIVAVDIGSAPDYGVE